MTNASPILGELTFTRTWDAPRELVFECMTTPEHLTHFWGPAGVTTPIEHITVDLRPGGVFETIMVNDADGTEFPSRGVYVEIVRPERLVWSEQVELVGSDAKLAWTQDQAGLSIGIPDELPSKHAVAFRIRGAI